LSRQIPLDAYDTDVPHFTKISRQKLIFETLKIDARVMRAAEQGLRKNLFKIEISIKTCSYFVKFEVRQKNQWAL